MSDKKKKKFDYQLMARIVSLAHPYQKLFFGTILLAIVSAPVGMIRPYIVTIMVDKYIMIGDMPGLYKMGVLFLIVMIATVWLRYLLSYYSGLLGQNIVRDLRNMIFDHLVSLRMRYFDQTPIGKLTTRTINDVETINTVFTQGIISIVADLLGIFAVLGIMLFTSVQLTLIVISTLPLLFIATYIFKEKVKVAYERVRTHMATLNTFLQENISGMRIIQIFNAEQKEMLRFKKINRDYTQANLDAILHYAVFFPVVECINYLALALLVYFGAGLVMDTTVSIGALMAFPWYINLLFSPMRMLADKFNTLQMGMVAADRVFDVIDTADIIENNGYIKPSRLKGDVKFNNVHFAYDGENEVLRDISFSLNAGETLAIVGSTGSGKTSVINVLARFYDIQQGDIYIDDKNLREYDLSSLRSRIAVVLQDVFLFHGSVYENITLRNPDISLDKVIESARAIGADKFIEVLEGGYHFEVMERGNNLSTGQRQLISFVRALVTNPDILVLDEATSSIDTETESIIQYAIEKLISKRSSIIIAHRLSTIRNANNIMVMDKGRLIEFGPHHQLIETEGGRYRELYEMQFSEELVS